MKKLLLASFVATLATATVNADNTDTATMTVNGKVIAALTVTADTATPLTFPDIVSPESGEGAATIVNLCDDSGIVSSTYSANANPFIGTAAKDSAKVVSGNNTGVSGATSVGTCGKMIVTGEVGYSFTSSIGIGSNLSGISSGVTFAGTSSGCVSGNASAANVISATAAENVLHCGGTISVAEATLSGNYSLDSVVTVIYD